jgi:hypothetical protein
MATFFTPPARVIIIGDEIGAQDFVLAVRSGSATAIWIEPERHLPAHAIMEILDALSDDELLELNSLGRTTLDHVRTTPGDMLHRFDQVGLGLLIAERLLALRDAFDGHNYAMAVINGSAALDLAFLINEFRQPKNTGGDDGIPRERSIEEQQELGAAIAKLAEDARKVAARNEAAALEKESRQNEERARIEVALRELTISSGTDEKPRITINSGARIPASWPAARVEWLEDGLDQIRRILSSVGDRELPEMITNVHAIVANPDGSSALAAAFAYLMQPGTWGQIVAEFNRIDAQPVRRSKRREQR